MFGNVLAATLRNLARNRLYALISVGGLAVGMAAAILTGLYVRDELSFDRFLPGHDKVYVAIWEIDLPSRPPIVEDWSHSFLAKLLELDFKEVQASARLNLYTDPVGVRRGPVEAIESVGWADPELFSILRLPVLAGDPVAALRSPDGAVITRAMARKYFGQDAPIGQVLELDHTTPLRVGAVLYDLPPTSHLTFQIFGSSLSAASPLRMMDANAPVRGNLGVNVRTYVRLADAKAAERLNAAMPAFIRRHIAGPDGKLPSGIRGAFRLIPLAKLHLYPLRGTPIVNAGPHGDVRALGALSLIAGLILAVASINFVNLMTGRGARRAMEVGVRKAVGARRSDLVVQFLGEAVIYTLIAMLLALALVELALPGARTLIDRPLAMDIGREPGLVPVLFLLAAGVGLLTGAYPALVLSRFRPAAVLKGTAPRTSGSAAVRAGLTGVQFAVLICLVLGVVVIGLQTRYALNDGAGVDKAGVLTLDVSRPHTFRPGPPEPFRPLCRDAFPDQVRRLPGVAGAACSAGTALDIGDASWVVQTPRGSTGLNIAVVDHGFFELYGLEPIAGRFFSREHPQDETPLEQPPIPRAAVVNESAARALGYARPDQAVGHSFRQVGGGKALVQIVGVAPDFAFDLTHGGIRPTAYVVFTPNLDTLNVKLTGHDAPATLQAIDALWRAAGSPRPPRRRFVDDYLQGLYGAVIRQGRLLGALCAVAVVLAGLGLFGLAAFTTERRTKEIGVRKAMGASAGDVTRLLLASFARPVLWANVLAWPLAWWTLDRWLSGFARHIALAPWMFLAAAGGGLLIALATVLAHTLKAAAARPVTALRYE